MRKGRIKNVSKDKRKFTNSARKIHQQNLIGKTAMRGGIRL